MKLKPNFLEWHPFIVDNRPLQGSFQKNGFLYLGSVLPVCRASYPWPLDGATCMWPIAQHLGGKSVSLQREVGLAISWLAWKVRERRTLVSPSASVLRYHIRDLLTDGLRAASENVRTNRHPPVNYCFELSSPWSASLPLSLSLYPLLFSLVSTTLVLFPSLSSLSAPPA